MTRRAIVLTSALLALCLGSGRAWAQETPEPEGAKSERAEKVAAKPEKATPRPDSGPTATLRVQVVISRFLGEKKTGSLPYSFTVSAGGSRARLRMGVETPVTVGGDHPSFSYKNVGTNIDCGAKDIGQGRYLLNLNIENSAVPSSPDEGGSLGGNLPRFRTFNASFDPVLRDGQTLQTVVSTDPLGGEVVKVDVTVNVVK
jgi:hypothetical protein